MQKEPIDISKEDWKVIISFGVLFTVILSLMGYILLEKFAFHGLIFGIILGLCVCSISVVFTIILSKEILPRFDEKYNFIFAVISMFSSGFLGVLLAYLISVGFHIELIESFERNLFLFAFLIGMLNYLIADLFYKLIKLESKKNMNEQLVINSRIKSLETQLNPHFIFNCLNSIAELVYHDSAKSEDMILKLSKFLRATMKENSVVPLVDEIRNVKRYIELENIRFSDKLTLIIECEESYNDILIPKFSIQLLAENAIKHGYNKSIKNFIIKIEVGEDDKDYLVKVSNTGRKIENYKPGIGMKNLDERLNYLCNGSLELVKGDNATFLIKFGECNENYDN